MDVLPFDLQIPATVALASIALIGYMISRARHGRTEFTLLDAVMVAIVVAILAGTAIPLLEAASRRAKASVLAENLHTLQLQIELYKLEHGGQAPVLFEGAFPQLVQTTDPDGVPGPRDSRHRFGPYLRAGVPLNPITGRSVVAPTDAFPPVAASGNGGWLYHQETGQIAADLDEFLPK